MALEIATFLALKALGLGDDGVTCCDATGRRAAAHAQRFEQPIQVGRKWSGRALLSAACVNISKSEHILETIFAPRPVPASGFENVGILKCAEKRRQLFGIALDGAA